MSIDDTNLDQLSRKVLGDLDELKQLERTRRDSARSSDEFHDLAEREKAKADEIFHTLGEEWEGGADDSPVPEEQAEQHPGDWTQ